MAVRVFDWEQQLAAGRHGESRVIRHLLDKGHDVTDVSHDKVWQRRDVDLVVDQWTVELKTDSHAPVNVFAETTVGGKPGYLYKSRADYLLTLYSRHGVLLWVPLSSLLWWIGEHGPSLKRRTITSRRSGRVWTAEGLLVPVSGLLSAGLAKEDHLDDTRS